VSAECKNGSRNLATLNFLLDQDFQRESSPGSLRNPCPMACTRVAAGATPDFDQWFQRVKDDQGPALSGTYFVLSANRPASATLHLPPFMGGRARSALLLSEWFGFTYHHPHFVLLLSGYPASLMPENIWYIYVVERILPLARTTSCRAPLACAFS
jgi:hypothetical protein